MNVADYIIKFLEKKKINTIFSVNGGGAMYLNDAVAKSKKITPIFMHHEQSCAMAAVGYSKTTNTPGVVLVTSGCGGTNTITGVLDAWQDSHPLIIISGQANLETTTEYSDRWEGTRLRKFGVQEANVLKIVESIVKQTILIDDTDFIDDALEVMWEQATTGRPGPVWVEIPLDIQSKQVSKNQINIFPPRKKRTDNVFSSSKINKFKTLLHKAERPVIIIGNGVLLANAQKELYKFWEKNMIPLVGTFIGRNAVMPEMLTGTMGIKGTRAGNFAIQNSDLIISLGSSLSLPAIGFQTKNWARNAKKIVIDIDPEEHSKKTIDIDLFIQGDVKSFLKEVIKIKPKKEKYTNWNLKCWEWKSKWSPFNRPDINSLNMYSFSRELSHYMNSRYDRNYSIVSDAGSAYYVLAQTLQGQELIIPSAQGEMGFMIPASIGVEIANKNKKQSSLIKNKTIGVTGEGSFQFNIQELQTIVHHKLPIILFVLNNGGYLSIKTTQNKFFNKRISGADENSGISFPDLKLISQAYGIEYIKVTELDELKQYLPQMLGANHPIICEVMCPHDEVIYPTSATKQMEDGSLKSQPLENMYPFLSQEEFENEMIVDILK